MTFPLSVLYVRRRRRVSRPVPLQEARRMRQHDRQLHLRLPRRVPAHRTHMPTYVLLFSFVHPMFPPVWSLPRTHTGFERSPNSPGLPSRWTQTLEQSVGFTASVRHDSRPVQETAEDSFV